MERPCFPSWFSLVVEGLGTLLKSRIGAKRPLSTSEKPGIMGMTDDLETCFSREHRELVLIQAVSYEFLKGFMVGVIDEMEPNHRDGRRLQKCEVNLPDSNECLLTIEVWLLGP